MLEILWYSIAGAIAQLVDGTLGMAFGITSSTALVLLGATAVSASTAVHLAEIGTTLASGVSHWRAGNVDRITLIRIALPGAIGAFIGASVLTHISLEGAKSFMSGLLFLLGLVLIIRFGFGFVIIKAKRMRLRGYTLAGLGLFAGFVDAAGGGGWGPITTPTLLTATKSQPRLVIGTVSAAEFAVAVAASIGFIVGLSTSQTEIPWSVVLGLMIGGVVMAPIAARLAGRLPHAAFGVLIGGLVIISNGRTLIQYLPTSAGFNQVLLAVFVGFLIWLARRAWVNEHK
ncbi:MAG: hypothetical protein RL038_753 [Actinomycetota bacterium]